MRFLRWLGAALWLWCLIVYAVGSILITLVVIVPYQWLRRLVRGVPMRIR